MAWQERLGLAVEDSGKTHEDIAKAADISPATLREIISGDLDPGIQTLVRIAAVLDVTIGWLLDEPVRGIELSDKDIATLVAVRDILERGTRSPE